MEFRWEPKPNNRKEVDTVFATTRLSPRRDRSESLGSHANFSMRTKWCARQGYYAATKTALLFVNLDVLGFPQNYPLKQTIFKYNLEKPNRQSNGATYSKTPIKRTGCTR